MRSLYWKISLAFTLVLLVIAFSYMLITTQAAKNYFMHTTQKLNASVADYLVEEVSPFKNGKVNEEALGTIMHSMMAVNPGIEVFLLNPSGEILSYVVLDSKVKLKRVNLDPIKQFIASSGEHFIVGDDPRSTDYKTIFSATEIYEEDKLLGYVYITLASEKYEEIASSLLGSYWLKLTFNSFVIALIVALLIGLVLTILLTRNLRKIVKTVNQFKEGNLKARIPAMKSQSELAMLASTFNQMADSILHNMESLQNVDNLRRELIANVSHDLRSPLAIINGYVETLMLKGDRITSEERNEYLKIINSSTDKLTKLVADLFELSKLESGQMQLKLEPLKIQELLYDSCLKYELLAKTKNITLQAEISESLPSVKADLYLIDRVVQNLIDNAVKYAPENGSVVLKAYYCNTSHRVCVSIKNSGDGIPEKDLSAIFDRYYMVDKEKNKIEGAGLGLAIVKKILEIHDSEIKIISDSSSFTEFVFELNPQLHFN
ncbi:HAMP domain-containing histidine kinase [Marivirga sp. S37H4]|uniref:histidine kinase n=1 Tax=Marivirga aurantiaca TaxID=2802615 RepID=A0A935CD53_9BACT|nr:HAMP domain-containing sensor histidine kinase [Marivirga aurantiaca]MBK6266578.1 HAMP domain-containing histidine kinase [Marivirga aurantiaca]